jgi:predicted flap endonuclease-1-like 5' DNA nuclease
MTSIGSTGNLMLDEMRTERDAWREQAQRLALPKP